jgi:hypothetical protein
MKFPLAEFNCLRENVASADCGVRKADFEEPENPAGTARENEDCSDRMGRMIKSGIDAADRAKPDAQIMPAAARQIQIAPVDTKRNTLK